MIVSAARFGTPGSHSRIGGTIRPSSNTLVARLGIEPGHGAADVVVVAEGLHERDHLRPVGPSEHRHRHAQVGQVPDAALGQVDVVVEEDVARPHRVEREVADDRVHQRGVRPAGQLAQLPVVDAGAEVVRVADHRRAGGAADRGLDLHLDRGQACPARSRRPPGRPSSTSLAGLVNHGHPVLLAATGCRRLPRSTRAVKPGCSGTVEPNSSMTAGPLSRSPGRRSGRQYTGVSSVRSKCTGLVAVRARSGLPSPAGCSISSGRRIGPIPVTRRLTHSTCCAASSRKS